MTPLRIRPYRDMSGEVVMTLTNSTTMLTGYLRDDDVKRLVRDLASLVGMAVMEQPKLEEAKP